MTSARKDENNLFGSFEDFLLRESAKGIYFNFLRDIEENNIKEDGSCELFNIIDEYIFDEKKPTKTINKGSIFYRARVIDDSEICYKNGFQVNEKSITKGFNEGGSREAPLGKSPAGRNNIPGASLLYVSDRMETACVEVKPVPRQYISVAKFRTTEKLQIVDFSNEIRFKDGESQQKGIALGSLFTRIMAQYTIPIVNDEEYRATQVLTDHIRKTGYDGVSYRSFYDFKGINYTFFNCSREKFEFVESRVVLLQSERRTLLDYNDKKVKNVSTVGFATFEEEFANDTLEQFKRSLIINSNK